MERRTHGSAIAGSKENSKFRKSRGYSFCADLRDRDSLECSRAMRWAGSPITCFGSIC